MTPDERSRPGFEQHDQGGMAERRTRRDGSGDRGRGMAGSGSEPIAFGLSGFERLDEGQWFDPRGVADKGNPNAMHNLTHLLRNADREHEAEQWYRRAADKGVSKAADRLRHLTRR
ncbi:hypothetical protein [Actinoallomurus sp. CA-150999]|uniref:hypothetical protein n=1 Tax=Actinoallomurus sp. CA-150999 TaxID=3239887 RepID=UPI003D914B41